MVSLRQADWRLKSPPLERHPYRQEPSSSAGLWHPEVVWAEGIVSHKPRMHEGCGWRRPQGRLNKSSQCQHAFGSTCTARENLLKGGVTESNGGQRVDAATVVNTCTGSSLPVGESHLLEY
eukprot:scaffold76047_cov26-Tisochrysis_lutea.AAC.2